METKRLKTPYQLQVLARIKQVRKDNKFTQEMVVGLLGTSRGLVGNMESMNTSHKYTLGHIERLCRKFKYPVSMIFLNRADCSNEELVEAIVKYEEGL